MDLFRRLFGGSSGESHVEQPVNDSEDQSETKKLDNSAVQPDHSMGKTVPLSALDGVTQPLQPETVTSLQHERISFGQTSDVGLVRSNNQDAALSTFFSSRSIGEHPDIGLFVVADGMGGHQEGEKASAITTRVVTNHFIRSFYLPILSGNKEHDQVPVNEMLIEAVQSANDQVIKNVPEGGTTVTAAAVIGDLVHIAHVGDSRAYLVSEEGIEQITRDHSLVQRLIELDQITPEEAETHPQKNVLYRALGQGDSLEVDILTRRMSPNSRLLICSDGLWGLIDQRDLYEIPMNTDDPQQACDKLVALANTHGGIDNITAILLQII